MCLSVILLVTLLSLILLLAVFHYASSGRKYWLHKKVPYREPCPIFGNFGATLIMRCSYAKMLEFYYNNYKNEKYVGIFQARRPTLMVIDLDIVKNIFTKDFASFSDRISVSTDTQREPLLRNLANMSGAEWKTMRHIVTPTFSSAKMKAMFPLVAECALTLRATMLQALGDIEVPDLMCRYTTDVIGSCAFGVNPGSLKNPDSPFMKMSKRMFKIDRSTLLKRYCRTFFPKIFRWLNLRTYSPDVEAFFTSTIKQVLEERRSTGAQRHDFLQLMLNVQKTETEFEMTDALITSNSFIFMLAGLETSSTTMSFCLYELAKDKDLQDRVRAEILECLERHGGLNYEAVSDMRLATQACLETLRLHPPTPLTTRLCTAPCVLSGTDLTLKPRDPVLIPLQCIQRDPRYFPNPEKFDPERFKDDFRPSGFLVFGEGPRSCPGERNERSSLCHGHDMTRDKVLEREILDYLHEHNFVENCIQIFVDFCSEKEYQNNFEPNIPVSLLERRSELEVRAEKCDVRVIPSAGVRTKRAPTPALVMAVADVLHNLAAFKRCPFQAWNEMGLYRLLFRCASWSNGPPSEVNRVGAASCRALAAVSQHKGVRSSLSTTRDCLHNVVATLTPLNEDELDATTTSARTQALLLVGSLLPDRSAADSLWGQLKDGSAMPFFSLLLQSLQSDSIAFLDAGIFCLTQLAQSAGNRKHPDKTKDESCVEFLDNLKSPYSNDREVVISSAGDRDSECQPEYMVEELCKALMQLFQNMALKGNLHESSQDERWCRLCSCLSSVLSVSHRSRLYCAHRQVARALLPPLQAVRDRLSVLAPLEAVRGAGDNPTLRTLYWLLTIMNCLMVDCAPAKESLAEDNVAMSLCRLWPWAMATEQLRVAIVGLLLTFTNNCPKACSSMCLCVGGRSLIQETCALLSREVALQSRTRPEALLVSCARTLSHCLDHHHCRAIILKSEALSTLARLRGRERSAALSRQFESLCLALARHADGAAAVLALRRAAPLPALAHAAHHASLRAAFLAAPDLLELLSGSLLTGGTAEVVSAARAVWALAANNHKAKLLLRSAHMPAAVASAQARLQRSADPAAQRALQLLNYTHTVLQTT